MPDRPYTMTEIDRNEAIPSGDQVEALGRAAFLDGRPCEAPNYGREDRRARWRIGWKKERALSGVIEATIPAADALTQHWVVTVSRNGEEIVTIESNYLSGREISVADEDAIRVAALNLLAFIGEVHPCG